MVLVILSVLLVARSLFLREGYYDLFIAFLEI